MRHELNVLAEAVHSPQLAAARQPYSRQAQGIASESHLSLHIHAISST